jgi:hypothetical protein
MKKHGLAGPPAMQGQATMRPRIHHQSFGPPSLINAQFRFKAVSD